jgi:acyl-[acyl-carrier-protein] desaturase
MRHWKIFDLEGLSAEGEAAREKLAAFMEQLDQQGGALRGEAGGPAGRYAAARRDPP